MFSKGLNSLKTGKKKATALLSMALIFVVTSAASAAPTSDAATVAAVTDGMTGIQMTALAVIGAVAAVAVTLFAAPYAWQYGKKIFKTVAR